MALLRLYGLWLLAALAYLPMQATLAQRFAYMVFPTQINNPAVEVGVNTTLANRGVQVLIFSKAEGLGIFAWRVAMTEADAAAVQRSDYVSPKKLSLWKLQVLVC